jgi:hypothetical protein
MGAGGCEVGKNHDVESEGREEAMTLGILPQATRSERAAVYAQVNAARDKLTVRFGQIPPLPAFDLFEAEQAGDLWRFNCGPASICSLLNMTPAELRPKMLDFERKGYTNPTLMFDVLHGLGLKWGGPWCDEGVPMAARYRHTHWVAFWNTATSHQFVFDVNAMCVGGWLHFAEWHTQLAPWLIKECELKGDGKFWPTHTLELAKSDPP